MRSPPPSDAQLVSKSAARASHGSPRLRPLKRLRRGSDARAMADPICPICNGDLLLSGEEDSGDDVHCPTCMSPCIVQIDEDGDTKVVSDL